MAIIDLHKLALSVGFEVVCVDDDYTNYEYMIRLKDIESMSMNELDKIWDENKHKNR